MAKSSIHTAQRVYNPLNFYKETTIDVEERSTSYHSESRINMDSIFSPQSNARKSERLFSERTNLQVTLELSKDKVNEEEEEEEEKFIIDVEDRTDLFVRVINEETKPYITELLDGISTEIIQVDPFKDCTDISVVELDDTNMSKGKDPTNKPEITMKSLPQQTQLAVTPHNKQQYMGKNVTSHSNLMNKSFALRRSNRNRLSKDTEIFFELDNVSNVSPTSKGKSRIRNSQSKSTEEKKMKRSIKTRGTIEKNKVRNSETRFSEKKNKTRNSKTRCTEVKKRSFRSKDKLDSTDANLPFNCIQCDKSFPFLSNLKAHEVMHTGIKAYSCNLCPRRYAQNSHLRRHLIIHEKNGKKFKCSVCKMKFYHKAYLEIHSRTHTKDKPYTCIKCNKSFSQKSHLNTHHKSHQKRGYTCDICCNSFVLLHHLLYHVKKIHKC